MVEIESYHRSVERCYSKINGEEVRTASAVDFLEKVHRTSSIDPLRWTPEYSKIAEVFLDVGIINLTTRGSWYATNNDTILEIRDELLNDLNRMD